MLNSSAIASGYAGRDPQGGFAMEALRVFIEIVKKTKESSSLFLKLRKWKRKLLVKVKKKAKDEEGGKSENDEKRLCTMKWRRKSLRRC